MYYQMAQRVSEDGPSESVEFMKLMLESQQQQSERLTVALEKIVASEVRLGRGMCLTSGD